MVAPPLWQGDPVASVGVELFAVAEFIPQAWADEQSVLRVDPQVAAVVQRSYRVWTSERNSRPLSSRCSPPAGSGLMCAACSTGRIRSPVTAQRRW